MKRKRGGWKRHCTNKNDDYFICILTKTRKRARLNRGLLMKKDRKKKRTHASLTAKVSSTNPNDVTQRTFNPGPLPPSLTIDLHRHPTAIDQPPVPQQQQQQLTNNLKEWIRPHFPLFLFRRLLFLPVCRAPPVPFHLTTVLVVAEVVVVVLM